MLDSLLISPLLFSQTSAVEAASLVSITKDHNLVFVESKEENKSLFVVGKLSNPVGQGCTSKMAFTPSLGMQIWAPVGYTLRERLTTLSSIPVNTPTMGFYEAKAACEMVGGQLPMIRNQEEYQDVIGILWSNSITQDSLIIS